MNQKFYTVGLLLLNDFGSFYRVDADLISFFNPVTEEEYFALGIAPQPLPYVISHITDNIINAEGKYMQTTMIADYLYPFFDRILNPLELGLKGQFASIDVERIDGQLYRQAELPLLFDSRDYQDEIF